MAWHVYCLTGTDGSGPTSLFTKVLCHLNDEAQVIIIIVVVVVVMCLLFDRKQMGLDQQVFLLKFYVI